MKYKISIRDRHHKDVGANIKCLKNFNLSISMTFLAILSFLCFFNYAYMINSTPTTAQEGFSNRKILGFDSSVTSEWDKLSRRDKIKLLDSNFDFQGKVLKFNYFNNLHPQLFKSLTRNQINSVLNRQKFFIGKNVESEDSFYVERRFIHEDAKLIRFEYQFGHDFVRTYEDPFDHEKRRTEAKTFEEFHSEFFKLSSKERSQILNKVRENNFYQRSFYYLNEDVFDFLNVNSTEVIKQAEMDKILVLASEIGLGKTSTLKQLSKDLKNKFPTKWISYVDLKSYSDIFKTEPSADNVEELLMSILGLDSDQNSFEAELFKESFKSGNVVLFWDDFAGIYSKFVTKFLKLIRDKTANIQFVSTDISNSQHLSELFDVRAFLLTPLNENEIQEFLQKIFNSGEIYGDNVEGKIRNVSDVLKKFDFNDKLTSEFNNPSIIKLIANFNFFNSDFIYKIYEQIMNDKMDYWIQKNQNLLKGNSKEFSKNLLKIILQKHAIVNEIGAYTNSILFTKLFKLQIMELEIPENFPLKEISQMNLFGDDNIFFYKSFSQFLVAQFFVENIYNFKGYLDSNEAELRLELFHHLAHVYGDHERIITDFMNSYLFTRNKSKVEKFNPVISTLLRTKFKNFFFRVLDTNHPKVFEFLFDFFSKDHDLLVDLLHVYEDETFYTAIFNPSQFGLFVNPKDIKNLARNYLNDQEFEKFVTGSNQKGLILAGMKFYSLLNVTKSNDIYKANNNENLSIWELLNESKESLTIHELKPLFMAFLNPKIYLYYDMLFNDLNFSDYENLWSTIESVSTKNEMLDIIGNNFINYLEIFPINKKDHQKFSSLLLEKADKFLSNSEIFKMFADKNILHEAVWGEFQTLWDFFTNYTSLLERKTILLKTDLDDKNFYMFASNNELKEDFSSSGYIFYSYDFTPYNIFHRSLVRPSAVTYNITKEIYQRHFSPAEMQRMILSSNDFLVVLITMSDQMPCERFVKYLEELFKGNEKLLKNYFDQKIYPTNSSLLEYVKKIASFDDFTDQTNNLKAFENLYEKL